jgi:hypothetical protein
MKTVFILQYAALISMMIGAISVALAFFIHRETVKTQIFLALSARYDELLHTSAADFWSTAASGTILPEPSEHLRISALRFCTLVSLAYYLFRERRIPKRMWQLMLSSAKRRMRTPLFLREWEQLRTEFESFPEFVALVSSVQDGKQK